MQAEHIWIAGEAGQSDREAAEHPGRRVIGRQEGVVAGQAEYVAAAGAINHDLGIDPAWFWGFQLDCGQMRSLALHGGDAAAHSQLDLRL